MEKKTHKKTRNETKTKIPHHQNSSNRKIVDAETKSTIKYIDQPDDNFFCMYSVFITTAFVSSSLKIWTLIWPHTECHKMLVYRQIQKKTQTSN